MFSRPVRSRHAFTLVELLVVIGIIALLISILLPSLNKARRAANTIKCGANLRSIGQAMQMYATQYRGCFPSPNTSGYFLMSQSSTYGNSNCPDINGFFDWQSPLATVMGIKLNRGSSANDRLDRFITLLNHPSFLCPENVGVLATNYTGSVPNIEQAVVVGGKLRYGPGARQYISYTAAMNFMFVGKDTPQPAGGPTSARVTNGSDNYNPPPGYFPKVNKIGKAAEKIYAADGGRFWQSNALNMNLDALGTTGGAYADVGPYTPFSNGMNRNLAPGSTPPTPGQLDARVLWARHGTNKQKQSGNAYKFNALFFDGHVSLLGDLEGSNPSYWGPKGMTISPISTEIPSGTDVYNTYMQGVSGTYTIGS